jgi:hypothetical protein
MAAIPWAAGPPSRSIRPSSPHFNSRPNSDDWVILYADGDQDERQWTVNLGLGDLRLLAGGAVRKITQLARQAIRNRGDAEQLSSAPKLHTTLPQYA